MKKILLTLLLALPFCMATKAQDFILGVTGGYNLSSSSGHKSQSGFHVGVKGELGLSQVTIRGILCLDVLKTDISLYYKLCGNRN